MQTTGGLSFSQGGFTITPPPPPSQRFVALSPAGAAMTSVDGITWTSSTVPAGSAWAELGGLATNDAGTFVTASYDGTNKFLYSTDHGVTWTSITGTTGGSYWQGAAYGNGTWILTAGGGSTYGVAYSTNATSWTRVGVTIKSWMAATYGNGVFVVVGTNGAVMRSTNNGVSWTDGANILSESWRSIAYGNGKFVAVNSGNNTIAYSTNDGVSWTTVAGAAVPNSPRDIHFANGLFVAVGAGGGVSTSTNGTTWTSRSAAAANAWQSVTYGNGTWVAVANSGANRVMTSPDGITWTARSAASASTWSAVAYG